MGRHDRDRKGSWIYKYLRNQRRSPLKLRVRILNLCISDTGQTEWKLYHMYFVNSEL